MAEKSAGTVQSVVRAIDILRCFENEQELGVTEISRMLGLHKSTTFGLVNTLAQESLLQKSPRSDKYQLGLGLFSLGMLVKHDLRSVAEPYLVKLVEQSQETVNLAVRDDDSVIYISKIESPHSMRICTQIGKRLPMYCTALGKAMLAFINADEARQILTRKPLTALTEKTMTDPDDIMDTLAVIRAQGYATDSEELEYGLTCLAAPIFNLQGKPIAGLSISGPTSRMDKALRERCSLWLRTYAAQIGERMMRG